MELFLHPLPSTALHVEFSFLSSFIHVFTKGWYFLKLSSPSLELKKINIPHGGWRWKEGQEGRGHFTVHCLHIL